ncbi:MAG: cytochrome b [Pseudomonadota bacterium]
MHDATLAERQSSAAGRTTTHFGLLSRLNHWITAAAFLGALGLGLLLGFGELSREAAGPYRDWHKALGLLVLVWGSWRILWRMIEGFPEPAAPAPLWQEIAAKAVHIGLLAATLALPVSGMLMSIAAGRPLRVFGVEVLPALGDVAWLDEVASAVHESAAPVLIVLLALHIGGALKHHWVDRDETLTRMVRGPQRP